MKQSLCQSELPGKQTREADIGARILGSHDDDDGDGLSLGTGPVVALLLGCRLGDWIGC